MNSPTQERKAEGHSVGFNGQSLPLIKCLKSSKFDNLFEVYLCPERRGPGRPANKYVGSLPLEPNQLYRMLPKNSGGSGREAKTIKLNRLYLKENQIFAEIEISTAEAKEIKTYNFPSCFSSGELSLKNWKFIRVDETEIISINNRGRNQLGDLAMNLEDLAAQIDPKTSIAALSADLVAQTRTDSQISIAALSANLVSLSTSDSDNSMTPSFLEIFEDQFFRDIGLGVWRYSNDKNFSLYGAFKDWLVGFDEGIDCYGWLINNIHPEERAEVAKQLELKFLEKQEINLEFRIFRESQTRWLLFRGRPLGNEIIGMASDISELKNIQAANKALLAAIPDMLFKINSQGIYLDFLSPSGKEPYVSPEELLGKSLEQVLPLEIALEARARIDEVFQTGVMQNLVYFLEDRQETHYYEAKIVRCTESEVLAIVRDITEEMTMKKNFIEQAEFLKCMNGELPTICYNFFVKGRETRKNNSLFIQNGKAVGMW